MEGFVALAGVAVAIAVYFLPSIVASSRRHRSENAIIALNLFLGWTFLGWVGSLVWALAGEAREEQVSASGGGTMSTSLGMGLVIIGLLTGAAVLIMLLMTSADL